MPGDSPAAPAHGAAQLWLFWKLDTPAWKGPRLIPRNACTLDATLNTRRGPAIGIWEPYLLALQHPAPLLLCLFRTHFVATGILILFLYDLIKS